MDAALDSVACERVAVPVAVDNGWPSHGLRLARGQFGDQYPQLPPVRLGHLRYPLSERKGAFGQGVGRLVCLGFRYRRCAWRPAIGSNVFIRDALGKFCKCGFGLSGLSS